MCSAVQLLGEGAQPALAMVLSLSLLGSATNTSQEKVARLKASHLFNRSWLSLPQPTGVH
eukprot:scaffold307903_cov17-Prasinocladus_malaysianus.AAC.1